MAAGCDTAQFRVGLVLVLLLLWFVKLPGRPLAHPDEGRYAEIPREMVVSGDWITPRLNGFAYLQKPPLQFWATAAAYKAFGVAEWTARLWTALTGLGTVLVTWFAGRRLLGRAAGDYGALALLASPYFVAMSGVNTLDMGVTFFLTGAVFTYLLSRQAATRSGQAMWMLVSWGTMALAVMSKGLIGIVLPLTALAGYFIWHREPRAFARLHWLLGLTAFAALTVPWFVLTALTNPGFLQFFFVHEHFQRFASTVHARAGPIWYFVPIVVLAVAPWIAFAAAGLVAAWRSRPGRGEISTRRALLVWCAVVFAFFSVSQSKLPAYVLPMVPALALLAGDALARGAVRRPDFVLAVGVIALGLIFFGAGIVFEHNSPEATHSVYAEFGHWTGSASMLLVVAGAIGLYRVDRAPVRFSILVQLLACYVSISSAAFAYREIAPMRSGEAFASQIKRLGPPEASVYAVQLYDQTLPFYLGRLVTVVAFTGELAPGIEAAPGRQIPTLEAFRGRWSSDRAAFAVMPPDTYVALRRDGLQMIIVAQDSKKVLVRKPVP